mmetsp:Transcript_14609/g.34691  ORF Transcript_14609/g.34691 Transcript_14609/m.34691 type:complete len:323 (+) Transcript_14609:163-1131(+)
MFPNLKNLLVSKTRVRNFKHPFKNESRCLIRGPWMEDLFPTGIVERPQRYTDAKDWNTVMSSNYDWPFPVEASSVVTCFMSAFSQGQHIMQAAEALIELGLHRELLVDHFVSLYQGFQLYVATLEVTIAEILRVIRAAERKANTTFWVGDKEDRSQSNGLLEILVQASELLFSTHLKLLHEFRAYAVVASDLSQEHLSVLFGQLQDAQLCVLRLAPLCIVDYCFHLRKNLTRDEVWDIIRKNTASEGLKHFPNFRGMRLRVLAGFVATIPRSERVMRLRHSVPVPVPVQRNLFIIACKLTYKSTFQRPLDRIMRDAEACAAR